MKVLVVDDNPTQADALVDWLVQNGHQADWTVCLTGAQAKFMLKRYDVVVTDLVVECRDSATLMEGLSRLPGPPGLVVLAPVPPGHPLLSFVPAGALVLHEPVEPECILEAIKQSVAHVPT